MHSKPACDRLATAIVNDLFTTGDGNRADRIALIVDGKDWCGYGPGPLFDRLVGIIRECSAQEADAIAQMMRGK